jgi:universal stress protein A
MLSIRRILVPTDFSPNATSALTYAVLLAERFEAEIEVLHVWESPVAYGPGVAEAIIHTSEGKTTLAQFVRTRAGKQLEDLLSDIKRRASVNARARLEAGDPTEGILKIAASGQKDLIVMGTHGRTGLSHLVMGSVAEKVVRRAPCPVLTIRVPEAAKVKVAS